MKTFAKFLKKIPFIGDFVRWLAEIEEMRSQYKYLYQRVHNHRWYAIEEVMGYLVGAQVPGDYCEFGTFVGDTFGHGLRVGRPALPNLRFFAFDSFQGLPDPKGVDAENGYTSNFTEGEFACDEKTFLNNILTKYYSDLSCVVTVPGWFDKSLTKETAERIKLDKIAAAWIDCDFYESCVPVLDFITDKLSVGSIIVFDDWHVYRNLSTKGVQKACGEWLQKNPGIKLTPLFSYAHYGEVFTVSEVPEKNG